MLSIWPAKSVVIGHDPARRTGPKQPRAPKRWPRPSTRADGQRTAAIVDQWDADPWLLNTPGGVIDLRTGTTRRPPTDYVTKMTAVSPDGHANVPSVPDEVLGGDDELVEYLQRVRGYCLTGVTPSTHCSSATAAARTAKSPVRTVDIMGDYHRAAPIETFTASKASAILPSWPGCVARGWSPSARPKRDGAGRKARIKPLTGGDTISARFMRQDFFDYMPQFKLIIAGNHKPALSTVDEAIRRRFNLFPLTVTIPPEKRDPQLPEKLKQEWPGILAWMIQGCTSWLEVGLAPPEIVTEATAAYLRI